MLRCCKSAVCSTKTPRLLHALASHAALSPRRGPLVGCKGGRRERPCWQRKCLQCCSRQGLLRAAAGAAAARLDDAALVGDKHRLHRRPRDDQPCSSPARHAQHALQGAANATGSARLHARVGTHVRPALQTSRHIGVGREAALRHGVRERRAWRGSLAATRPPCWPSWKTAGSSGGSPAPRCRSARPRRSSARTARKTALIAPAASLRPSISASPGVLRPAVVHQFQRQERRRPCEP